MSFLNRPDRLVLDSFSDPNLKNLPNNGVFSRFTNFLNTPLLNVKGLQLLRSNFVNPSLPLSDYNGQLLFVYCRAEDPDNVSSQDFHVVRLHPSWFVPDTGFTTFTKNKYFNDGTELVASLNLAASANGDSVTYNPSWIADDVTFSFDTQTRKISVVGNTVASYYSIVPTDHPQLEAFLSGANQVKMNSINNVTNNYAGAMVQPRVNGVIMNPRLGFGLKYNNIPVFKTIDSVLGCATSSGIPQLTGSSTEADSFPILLATQNVNTYASVIVGSGNDSRTRKNLLASIPIENASLGVNSYTLTSIEQPASTVQNEIYQIDINFTDDEGNEFLFLPNMNVSLELAVYY